MTPLKGLAALVAAFTAGLSATFAVIDSSGPDGSSQHIETGAPETTDGGAGEQQETLVAMADTANRALIRVGDEATDGVDDGSADDADGAAASSEDGTDGDTADGGASADGAEAGSSGSSGGDDEPPSGSADGTGSSADAGSATPGTTSTTQPPTTTAPSTTGAPRPAAAGQFESIRNRDPLFERYADVPSNQLSIDALTIPANPKDNGAHPDGNFRMACAYSHFSYDDPIVFPGQPGKSHLHMFFGNTRVDAHTTTDSLVNSGGGSCNGFELNRSGYWTPAMLDGKGNVVVPDQIILYYKTKHPSQTVGMPQGLKMIAGNPRNDSFTVSHQLHWACGASGTAYNKSNQIPNNCGSDPINAAIQFPFCWDGKNLDSADHISHLTFVNDNESCPASHPVRLPQITILMYFPPGNTSGWHLSSDRHNGANTAPGATLHADWFGGWNDDALNLWIDGCIRASRNCSYGQTGTSRMFAKLNNLQTYQGDNFLPLP